MVSGRLGGSGWRATCATVGALGGPRRRAAPAGERASGASSPARPHATPQIRCRRRVSTLPSQVLCCVQRAVLLFLYWPIIVGRHSSALPQLSASSCYARLCCIYSYDCRPSRRLFCPFRNPFCQPSFMDRRGLSKPYQLSISPKAALSIPTALVSDVPHRREL